MEFVPALPLVVRAYPQDPYNVLQRKEAEALEKRSDLLVYVNSPQGRLLSDRTKRRIAQRIGLCTRVAEHAHAFMAAQEEQERNSHRLAMGREYGGRKMWGKRAPYSR